MINNMKDFMQEVNQYNHYKTLKKIQNRKPLLLRRNRMYFYINIDFIYLCYVSSEPQYSCEQK